jgi:hypothetical protein
MAEHSSYVTTIFFEQDRHDKTNSHFSQFYERAEKKTFLNIVISFSCRCNSRQNGKLSLKYSHTVGNFISMRVDVDGGTRMVILQETDTEVRGSYAKEEILLTADE